MFFSFGARRPAETLRTQRADGATWGSTVRSLMPGFNFYTGAGILAGTSHLYHLRTTPAAGPPVTGRYDGPLYSARPGPPPPGRTGARAAGRCTRSARAPGGRGSPS